MSDNWIKLNGPFEIGIWIDTKHHKYEFQLMNSLGGVKGKFETTKAKGDEIIKFLGFLETLQDPPIQGFSFSPGES